MKGLWFYLARVAYRKGLRAILKSYINRPDKKWDDAAMGVLDEVMGYSGK